MRQLCWQCAFACSLLTLACTCGLAEKNPEDPIIARVHQKELRLSELAGMFPDQATRQDSQLIIQAFTSRWTKTAALQWEAEHNLPTDLNIDRLVRDYRSSLVSNHYEELLVGSLMDSAVTHGELQAYYDEHKQQYLLERPIVRCFLIRVPYPIQEEAQLQALWNNGKITDTLLLRAYCQNYAEVSLLDVHNWYDLDDIIDQLPSGVVTAGNIQSKKEFSLQEGSYRYYFRLFEVKPRLEVAPLSYVEDQARSMMLQNRKHKVLDQAREDIYQREVRRNNVEVFPLIE